VINLDKEPAKVLAVSKFTKTQIIKSAKYSNRRDVLSVLLQEEKEYSLNEVNTLIDKFMKGKVK